MPTTNPVPSTDPTDLLFNAGKLDEVVNGAGSTYTDRLGVTRRTLGGIDAEAETRMDAIDAAAIAQRDNIQDAADIVLAAAGYAPPVAYAAGISLTLQTQTVSYNGDTYAPKQSELPFTTSGTFEAAKFRLIQGVASADLPALVGQDVQDYDALRVYTGLAKRIYITGLLVTAKPAGIAGVFQHDPTDTTSLDNGGTVIVSADGRRWKRQTETSELNVKWFGAVVNGTENDTDAVLLALAALPGKSGVLLFPAGVCLTDPIDLRQYRNITIRGENDATVYPYVTSSMSIIRMRSNGDVAIKTATPNVDSYTNPTTLVATIENLLIDCLGKTTYGINIARAIRIQGTVVQGAIQDGIVFEVGTFPVWLDHVLSRQNGRHGIYVPPSYTTIYQISNTECTQNGSHGFAIFDGSGSQLINCFAQSNTGNGFHIEYVDPAGLANPIFLERLVFLSCYSEANGGWGIYTNSYNTNPASFVGKIADLTFINCAFNSGNGQNAYVRGLRAPQVINTPYVSAALDPLYNTVAIDKVTVQGSVRPKYQLDLSLPTSGQILFPSTQNQSSDGRVLDDYREGAFTPVIEGAVSAGSGTYTAQAGKYTKIGNIVFFSVRLVWTAHTGTGPMRISLNDIPYSSALDDPAGVAAFQFSELSIGAGLKLQGSVGVGTKLIILFAVDTNGGTQATVNMDAAGTIRCSGHFFV